MQKQLMPVKALVSENTMAHLRRSGDKALLLALSGSNNGPRQPKSDVDF